MSQKTFDNVLYEVVDASGGDDCLFKALALGLQDGSIRLTHQRVRTSIVNYVIAFWDLYKFWIESTGIILFI